MGAAWTYRFPARVSRVIRNRSAHRPEPIRATAWKAQVRLARRSRRLMTAGQVAAPQVITAIARGLVGFTWAIARRVEAKAARPCGSRGHKRTARLRGLGECA